jgi:hypothetical protein
LLFRRMGWSRFRKQHKYIFLLFEAMMRNVMLCEHPYRI